MDVSTDFLDAIPVSARPWQLESWSPDQAILTPNAAYWGDDPAVPAQDHDGPEDGRWWHHGSRSR